MLYLTKCQTLVSRFATFVLLQVSPLWTALYRDAARMPVAFASLPVAMWTHVYLETRVPISNQVVMMASVYGAAGWARRRLQQVRTVRKEVPDIGSR
jgi:hypothetical protein